MTSSHNDTLGGYKGRDERLGMISQRQGVYSKTSRGLEECDDDIDFLHEDVAAAAAAVGSFAGYARNHNVFRTPYHCGWRKMNRWHLLKSQRQPILVGPMSAQS